MFQSVLLEMICELLRVFCRIDEISEAFSEDIPGTTDFDSLHSFFVSRLRVILLYR